MRYVLLDANFLMSIEEFKIDIFSELNRLLDFKYSLVTLKPVVNELKRMAKGKGRKGRAARVSLDLLGKIRVIDTKIQEADKAILEFAKEKNAFVCTNDRKLRKELKEIGIKVIYLRGKNHLKID